MNYQTMIIEIAEARAMHRSLRNLIEVADPKHQIITRRALVRMQAIMNLMNSCNVPMPEITELDMQLDRYWDKKDMQDEARSIMESIENEVRFTVCKREFGETYDTMVNAIRKSNWEGYDAWYEGEMEAADCERYEW